MSTLRSHDIFDFGKYRGQRVDTIRQTDPQYLYWLVANTDVRFSSKVMRDADRFMKRIEATPPLPQHRNTFKAKLNSLWR